MKSRTHRAALLLAGALLARADTPARATEVGSERPIGVGFAVGEPTGIVAKFFVSPSRAWDAGLALFSAWSRCKVDGKVADCQSDTNISLNVDHLWIHNLLTADVKLDMHFGVGARTWVFTGDADADNFALAARAPFGVDFTFNNPDFLEAYLEFAPILVVVPSAFFHLEAALGVRFYF